MLKEYDSVAPLDEYIGTKNELIQSRKLVVLFCECIHNNPYLSPIGRFLLKKLSLNMMNQIPVNLWIGFANNETSDGVSSAKGTDYSEVAVT